MSSEVTFIQHQDSLPDLDTEQGQHQELMQTEKSTLDWHVRN